MRDSTPGPAKKHLNGITLFCLAFVICNSWAGIAGSLQLALMAGGPATLIYSILVATSAYFAIAASMAELAAVYPTAGGQYHFASILAPQRWRRGVSYTCGLLALFSWLVIGVSVTSITAQQLLALVSTSLSDFVPQPWHVFFVYQGFALFAMLYNAFILKRTPWTHNLAYGVCFLIGLSTSCYMYNGLDGAMHMAEESSNPEKVVPRTTMGAIGIGFTTGFAYTVAQIYAISDIQEIMTTSHIVLSMTIIIATQEASSRLAWSLARDKGLLFSQHLQDIHPRFDVPMWGLLLVWLLTFTCGFLYLASKTGFFLLLGLANWWLHAKEQYNGPVIETWEGREAEPARIAIPSQPKNMNEGIA
ncbi:Choline transport protein [Penicillium subrubescens]|uniref:Choline transport protein n=1 Tax=Penicillium subrubescens TaxID=1316194 RepID=A0A1Q5UBT9_9EURO|nr:Choline transport protein [Penicillium subrubescens]